MAGELPLTPILKNTEKPSGKSSYSRRRSVTFRATPEISNPENVEASSTQKDSSNKSSSNSNNYVPLFTRESKIQFTDFGLCYTPEDTPTQQSNLPPEAAHPQTAKVISKEHCKRPELPRARPRVDQYNVVIFGDVIHGKCLKNQLEDYPEIHLNVSLLASPTKNNLLTADFVLILLPLEVIGSCSKAVNVLQRVLSLRADGSLRCAAVGVSKSAGRDQHVTELFNIHMLLLQHSLSYYIWCDTSPGSWPTIVKRMAAEVVSCGEMRGPLPRPALCSLLWPSDVPSFLLQQYLDQTVHRTVLDLTYE